MHVLQYNRSNPLRENKTIHNNREYAYQHFAEIETSCDLKENFYHSSIQMHGSFSRHLFKTSIDTNSLDYCVKKHNICNVLSNLRSEERRVGKECRFRVLQYKCKKEYMRQYDYV